MPYQAETILASCTHPRWFAAATKDLHALLSDHLHCERKAAENALSLVRRYPHRAGSADALGRLAHEETSHVVLVAGLIASRGWTPRTDLPNQYARGLFAEVRGREPQRLLDSLLVAAFIEARSHERLALLARGFATAAARNQTATAVEARAADQGEGGDKDKCEPSGDDGDGDLSVFYVALAAAEARHAAIFLELAAPLVPPPEMSLRLAYFSQREGEILASLPHVCRVH
jgi:tRNA 2-(methylsulfanyl)-N6-isopentenyladenosine37 hydroxylase